MEQVQMFMTTDGQVFATAAEAKAHEEKMLASLEMQQFQADLTAAGWAKDQVATTIRCANLYRTWKETKAVPGPIKRPRKPKE